jgi:hypothetical protein
LFGGKGRFLAMNPRWHIAMKYSRPAWMPFITGKERMGLIEGKGVSTFCALIIVY